MLPSHCTVSVQVKFRRIFCVRSEIKVVKVPKVAHTHVTAVDNVSLVDMEWTLGAGGSPRVEAC